MNTKKFIFLLLVSLLVLTEGVMSSDLSNSAIHTKTINTKKIESLIQQHIPNTKVGIILQNAKTGETLYKYHADEAFTPASCTKLLTAAAGLLYLGPDYHYETAIKIKNNSMLGNIVNGDIYFQFSGDPSLTSQDLKALIKELRNAGVLVIKGNIIIDDTRFKGLNYGLGWIWNSLWWYYSAPITTVMLNQNAVQVELSPTKAIGEKIVATLDPNEASRITLRQDLISVSEEDAGKNCIISIDTNAQNDIELKGCWPVQAEKSTLKIAFKDPNYYARKVIMEAFKEEELRFVGEIKEGVSIKDDQDLKTVAVHNSQPFTELLKPILQDSNNIYTESVTKTLGFMRLQEGSFQGGVRAIQEILSEKLKFDTKNMRLMDGSGLSRYNLITPHQFADLLFGMYKNKTFADTFRNTLATTGENGTLKDRGDQKPQGEETPSGKIYAKTGSLMGVSTLSGYITTKKGEDLIFSIMIDDALQDKKIIKNFEDELCRLFSNV